jgi:hypothetical protein
MTNPALAFLAPSALLLMTGTPMAEEPTRPSPEEVRDQIRMLESSVTESSVTRLYSAEQREAKLDLLARAEAEADQGDVDAALALVEQAGRMLYPMQMEGANALDGDKRREWLARVSAVIETILPPAYGIAEEKGRGTANLDRVARQRELGLSAWQAGDIERAEALIITAYNRLQSEVAALRSGDLLTIELPLNDTREAWEEAERRYLDWRFTADWMEQSAEAMDADPAAIATGSRLADDIYKEAAAHAQQQRWAAAVKAIDRAYAVMEEHWRLAGIDI